MLPSTAAIIALSIALCASAALTTYLIITLIRRTRSLDEYRYKYNNASMDLRMKKDQLERLIKGIERAQAGKGWGSEEQAEGEIPLIRQLVAEGSGKEVKDGEKGGLVKGGEKGGLVKGGKGGKRCGGC